MAYTEITHPDTSPPPKSGRPVAGHWSTVAPDPNAREVLENRATVLANAWRAPIASRTAFLRSRVAGRSVLDVGCVAHDEARMNSAEWLHRQIADSASSCVGVDVLEDGVGSMQARGFTAVAHDLANGLGPVADFGLFQTIVAGELIEHLGNLDMLFATAAEALTIDGELILTTPNPYAPARVRAGQRGDVWENVDHVTYAFPSGIAELASRHGLMLAEAMTTEPQRRARTRVVRRIKQTILKSRWHRRGYATTLGAVRPVVLDRLDNLDRLRSHLTGKVSTRHQFVGETFIYVVQRQPLR